MERLTTRCGNLALIADSLEGKYKAEQVIDILAERLADYEDTGLAPEEVVAMKEELVALEKIVAFNTSCTHCKHKSLDAQQEPCLSCDPGMEKSAWEWEGA